MVENDYGLRIEYATGLKAIVPTLLESSNQKNVTSEPRQYIPAHRRMPPLRGSTVFSVSRRDFGEYVSPAAHNDERLNRV
jgi:hypothetical protein